MSGYRNYASPWNKPSASYSSGTVKKETTGGIPKYDTSYSKSRPEPKKEESTVTSRIASKYTSPYSAGYQRDTTTGYGARTETSRIKPILDKKDTSHPPVSYRPINRTGARSRDSSPIEKSDKSTSSTSSSYNYGNRLYPRPFQRSVSKERVDSTIPKYTGRSASATRDEIPKYGSTLSVKEDVPKYLSRSPSRNASREDLTAGSQKSYINSRFLPKNTVEKSYTAYSRPLSVRTNETSRKNRELLNVLHAQQEQERLSRPASRCSSTTAEDISSKEKEISSSTTTKSESPVREIEMVTVQVVTRGTSPTPISQNTQHPTFLRSRRIEIAKVVEKQITRPKNPVHTMVDKEIQSDRLDDSTKISRFSGASRMSATPWSSFLDMKFNSPAQKSKANAKPKECDSPKSLSRTSSTKSLEQSPAKTDKPKEVRKSPSPAKSKIVPPKQISDKKQLPPIPKGDNAVKTSSLHSSSPNKDFRKSVLNMNPEGKSKKIGRRSNSASSAESDTADPEATDVSENLKSCGSYHKSNSSKLPQKSAADRCHGRSRRSPSAETSNTTSGSEDDSKTRKIKGKLSAGSSRTSVVLSSGDELSTDKSPKPPQSPRNKYDVNKSEVEAKSFLMRALAPVTNFFKVKPPDSPERANWMDPSSESNTETKSFAAEPITARIIIHRVEPTEPPWCSDRNVEESNQAQEQSTSKSESDQKPWWENSTASSKLESGLRHADSIEKPWWENGSDEQASQKSNQHAKEESKKLIKTKNVDSGETPWWLDENAEVPEGVETYPNYVREDGTTADGRVVYKIRKNDSSETCWWQSSSEKSESNQNKTEPNNSVYPETQSSWVRDYKPRKMDSEDGTWWLSSSEKTDSDKNKTNIMDPEYQRMHQIRHIDSGERSWWLNQENETEEQQQAPADQSQIPSKFPVRHQDSPEKPWWLQDRESNKEADNDFDSVNMPLGDRASPEGLEMPKDVEGRKSPYDNVPSMQRRPQKGAAYISRYMNIDEVLGGAATQMWSPLMDQICGYAEEPVYEVDPDQVVIHEGDQTYQKMIKVNALGAVPKGSTQQTKVSPSRMFVQTFASVSL
ncbi:unnamed protein product [Acanthoscelides obtectus]|uniref:Uncharacterized protein n=1 Tax=Acanthoscelides obtectus TaxID=200917 RepID=A0A9P0L1X9_ACAOB|nr:unnamed protein product [Acanthoscelides obtectus]CAK1646020.1 hypothetical protein AOBTE_LOCUS14401 [Acanthoscelides obtectus]